MKPWAKQKGFTIVELLIVIVVIGILAAISIVAYTGVQQRGRDSQRASDIQLLTKALELYYIDNGKYPIGGGSTVINSWWTTTADASWLTLQSSLAPYLGGATLPRDPKQTSSSAMGGGLSYDYYGFNSVANACGAGDYQGYLILYRFESQPRKDVLIGDCTTNPQYFGAPSNHRISKK